MNRLSAILHDVDIVNSKCTDFIKSINGLRNRYKEMIKVLEQEMQKIDLNLHEKLTYISRRQRFTGNDYTKCMEKRDKNYSKLRKKMEMKIERIELQCDAKVTKTEKVLQKVMIDAKYFYHDVQHFFSTGMEEIVSDPTKLLKSLEKQMSTFEKRYEKLRSSTDRYIVEYTSKCQMLLNEAEKEIDKLENKYRTECELILSEYASCIEHINFVNRS